MKLVKNESEITLLQSHYVEKVLRQFGFMDSKTSPTPYDPSVTLRKNTYYINDNHCRHFHRRFAKNQW
jgi:hypothetical protein